MSFSTRDARALADRLVSDELVVLPVRHHSPTCALHVRDVLRSRRPSVVLVEGPRAFTELAPLLTHPAAQMPLAVYTYVARHTEGGEERHSAFYPFCDYSPELVALREAAQLGVPARFIDLDLAEQTRSEQTPTEQTRTADPASLLDERHFAHSAALSLLADRLGCRDEEDLWEHLFESAPVPLAEHLARMTAYCLMARHDRSEDALRADGTAAREAEMTWQVAAALEARAPADGPVVVVLGGFHAVALPDLLANPPARPTIASDGARTDAALIRYTFERLERLNGYAAGMTAPAWQQRLWECLAQGRLRADATLDALMEISGELRRSHGMPVPVPTVTSAYGQALELAALRERPSPLRTDLLDAITSCLVKGDADVEGRQVMTAARRVLTGDRIGVVPPGAGTPPLVGDTLERLRRQRLHVDSGKRVTTHLDLYRSPHHRTTSRVLHGLALLEVPFAVRTAGPDFVHGRGLDRLQERWDYQWSPTCEGALVEASVLGATLPEAIGARFADLMRAHELSADRASASAAVTLLAEACLLGQHDHLDEIIGRVREALAEESTLDGAARAAVQMTLLWESREPLEARRLAALPELVQAAYARAVFLGRDLRGAECPPRETAEALVMLRELLVGEAGERLDPEPFWRMVDHLSTTHEQPFVRGAASGIAYSATRLADDRLAVAVDGHLSGTIPAEDAVGFLSGLLTTAREAAWQNPRLVAGLDRRLSQWDEATFVTHLPELRLAFATMTPVETDRVAASVARLHGLTDLGPVLRDVDEAALERHLLASARVAELLAADGLAGWPERSA